jgi:hypothetical protein
MFCLERMPGCQPRLPSLPSEQTLLVLFTEVSLLMYMPVSLQNDPAIFSWNLYNEPRNPYSQKGPGDSPA